MGIWEPALMISEIGGAIVFAYIASTFPNDPENEFFNNLRLFFYFIAMLLVLAGIGTNYAIIDTTSTTLLQYSNGTSTKLGSALNGTFFGLLAVIVFVFLIFAIVIIKNIIENFNLKKKKNKEGFGDED